MRPTSLAVVVLAAAVAAPSWAADRRTSDRFSFSTYKEETNAYVALVDGYPASLRADQAYLPVPIALGLRGGIPRLVLTSESFELIDSRGKVYPLAGYGEVTSGYDMLSFDRSLVRTRPLVAGLKFATSHRVSSRFFPVPGRDVRIDHLELAPFTWFSDVLYFPKPDAGIGGVLTLRIKGQGLDAPIEVRFVTKEDRRLES